MPFRIIFISVHMSFDDRRAAGGRSGLTGIYTEYVGEPEDRTTVYGYWLYVVAYGLGLLLIIIPLGWIIAYIFHNGMMPPTVG